MLGFYPATCRFKKIFEGGYQEKFWTAPKKFDNR